MGLSCIALLALIVLGCRLCYHGLKGKKDNIDSVEPVKGAEPEIYQALSDMTTKTGLPPSKVKAYVDVLEQHDIYNKDALFLITEEQLDNIAKECRMGAPT